MVQQTNADYPRVMGLTPGAGAFPERGGGGMRGTHSIAVNQTLVRRYFSGGEAIGRLIRIPAPAHAAVQPGGRFVPDRRRGEGHGEPRVDQRDLAGDVPAVHA